MLENQGLPAGAIPWKRPTEHMLLWPVRLPKKDTEKLNQCAHFALLKFSDKLLTSLLGKEAKSVTPEELPPYETNPWEGGKPLFSNNSVKKKTMGTHHLPEDLHPSPLVPSTLSSELVYWGAPSAQPLAHLSCWLTNWECFVYLDRSTGYISVHLSKCTELYTKDHCSCVDHVQSPLCWCLYNPMDLPKPI